MNTAATSSSGAQRRVVLVTGGTKGIGRAIAEAFLAAGDHVIVCARNAADALPRSGAASAEFMACDVKDLESVKVLFAGIVQRHGRLDVLVNNAGGSPAADAATASPRFHESVIRLNLLAPLNLAQAANTQMQQQPGGGVIVFIGSVAALRPSPGTAAYGAAKAAVLSLVSSLVRTEQSHLHYGDEAGIAAVGATIPAGRMAEPDDVANACLWVASPQAAFMSGTNLLLHGGGERPAFLGAAQSGDKK